MTGQRKTYLFDDGCTILIIRCCGLCRAWNSSQSLHWFESSVLMPTNLRNMLFGKLL